MIINCQTRFWKLYKEKIKDTILSILKWRKNCEICAQKKEKGTWVASFAKDQK